MADRIPNIERCSYGERCDRDRIHVPLRDFDIDAEQKTQVGGQKMPRVILCEKHAAEHAEARRKA